MIIDMTVSAMEQKLTEQKQWDWETARLKMIYGKNGLNNAGVQCMPLRVHIDSMPPVLQECILTDYTVSDNSIGFTYSSSDGFGLEYNFSGLDAPVESLDQSTEWWTI